MSKTDKISLKVTDIPTFAHSLPTIVKDRLYFKTDHLFNVDEYDSDQNYIYNDLYHDTMEALRIVEDDQGWRERLSLGEYDVGWDDFDHIVVYNVPEGDTVTIDELLDSRSSLIVVKLHNLL